LVSIDEKEFKGWKKNVWYLWIERYPQHLKGNISDRHPADTGFNYHVDPARFCFEAKQKRSAQ
jgi:hypothetical protein